MQQQFVELGGEGLRLGQIADADGAARDLVLISWADASTGGADLVLAARRFPRTVQRAMQRQDQRRVLGDAQRLRRDDQALPREPGDLRQQRLGVDDDAVADDAKFAAHKPAGQQG